MFPSFCTPHLPKLLTTRFSLLRTSSAILPREGLYCAGGYRSAAGSSILEQALSAEVLDMSEAVTELKQG